MPEPVITTSRTARHALPYLFPGQAQKEAFVNEALARLDALVHGSVLDERNDPPPEPAAGDSHIVGSAPTGAWLGRAGALATWAQNQWLFATPVAGALVFDSADGSYAFFDAEAGWRRASASPPPTGGATQDVEARAAITAISDALRNLGFFA